MTYYSIPPTSDELYHYGIKGMRWGVRKKPRKYRNADGSLSRLGKMRDDYRQGNITKEQYKKWRNDRIKIGLKTTAKASAAAAALYGYHKYKKWARKYDKRNYHKGQYIDGRNKHIIIKNMTDDEYKKWRNDRIKIGLETAAVPSAVAAALYGHHKYKKGAKKNLK